MLTFSRLNSLLKIVKESCSKRLKHRSTAKKVPIKENKKYTSTVLLPKTDFAVWLSNTKRVDQDENVIKECGFGLIYNWQREHVTGPEYVLHDGPPYANGMPHMGHAINKILKDITIRHKLLQGYRVHYKPGWDCHGLPIELKAMAGQDISSLSPLTIRNQARKFAKEAIRNQKALFQSWGVMADWDHGCYLTFEKDYVENQLQQFYKLYEKGLVYRDVKPVYWSPSSRSALAEAELQYKEDHESQSVYVRVRVKGAPAEWGKVYALLWTTTPWTLPANQAVAYSPSLPYSLVTLAPGRERYLLATPLLSQVATTLRREVTVITQVTASELSSLRYEHPLDESRELCLLPADHVTAEKGSGLVHIAPAHGPDDFKLGKKHGLLTLCLVDEKGQYTSEAGPQLSGLDVLTSGSERVIQLCRQRGSLMHVSSFRHSYPYDWRTNLPVILRASHQWFFDTTAVKQNAIEALKKVTVIPERGAAGLMSQVESRPFWCISRQRVWGVPIPVLYTTSGQPVISKELVDHYCGLLRSEGDDFWWSCSMTDLAPSHLLAKLNLTTNDVERGQDILDIWLDSGLSWSSVLDSPTADLYLEGVDQFNGWFQSSLMTSVALQQAAPYKTVFVHGFAVDKNGMKMSKSLGNVTNPQDIMYGGADPKKQPAYGIDTLRWWVAAHATHQASVPVSPTTLAESRDSVTRLRSMLRFLLGSLHGLTSAPHSSHMRQLDLYMLHCLHALEPQIVEQYNSFQYNRVCATINNFVANEVSALYCHLTKDRLYCSAEGSEERTAVQTTLYHTLITLCKLIAPILPLLAEEVHKHLPVKESEFLFQSIGPSTRAEWHNLEAESVVQTALSVKQELAKFTPLNCSQLELVVQLSAPTNVYQLLKVLHPTEGSSDSELAEILQVSSVVLRCADEPLKIAVELTSRHLCERCRRYTALSLDSPCPRCTQVLQSLNFR